MKSVIEFAKEKKLSKQRINILIRQGRIKAILKGGTYIILSDTIQPPKFRGRPPKEKKK